ncbi:chloride channel protein [Bifidobacterium jacchi]|uniref:Chloride channel protein n=1 Tax=Bifidobacterium jacchi TaxID=2490545 RepID=A0A5N5RN68_9BIFI|nr:chloride channel protein [Bifidobacterium jacchi]
MRRSEDRQGRRFGIYAFAMLALGVVIGAGAGLLTLLLYAIERLMLGYVEGSAMPGPYGVPSWRRAVSVVIGLSVAAVIWWLLRTRTTKVPSVKRAVAGERMPWWQTVVHVCLQIGIVGSGASIGREVAPRELGAMIAQRFCDLFALDSRDRRVIVAVAAGAGLGGVYDAPLAGMFFAVEMLLADVTIDRAAFALGMSATAAYTASLIKGRHTFYGIAAAQSEPTITLMLFALLIGAACGAAGAWFRRGSSWAQTHQPKGAAVLWQMPLAGLATAGVACFVPQIMGNGRAAAQLGFGASWPLDSVSPDASRPAGGALSETSGVASGTSSWALLGFPDSASTDGSAPSLTVVLTVLGVLALTFALKSLITLATIRSGASGGVLQPGIALGATLGAFCGVLWTLVMPWDSITSCALIGAAALLAASQQAPLMAMCLVMELTAAPVGYFVPVGLAVAVSAAVSHHMLERGAAASRMHPERH